MDPWFGIEQEYTLMRCAPTTRLSTVMICCIFLGGGEIRDPNLLTIFVKPCVRDQVINQPVTMECNKRFWFLITAHLKKQIRARSWRISTLLHLFWLGDQRNPGKMGNARRKKRTAKSPWKIVVFWETFAFPVGANGLKTQGEFAVCFLGFAWGVYLLFQAS